MEPTIRRTPEQLTAIAKYMRKQRRGVITHLKEIQIQLAELRESVDRLAKERRTDARTTQRIDRLFGWLGCGCSAALWRSWSAFSLVRQAVKYRAVVMRERWLSSFACCITKLLRRLEFSLTGRCFIFASDDGRTWTALVTRPAGRSCILAAGKHWEALKVEQDEPVRWDDD
jgi:hypothetical protein